MSYFGIMKLSAQRRLASTFEDSLSIGLARCLCMFVCFYF